MLKNNKGFTLIEIFVCIVIISVLIFIVIGHVKGVNTVDLNYSMQSYVSNLHPELTDVRVQCSNQDSDMNGYYRCTATDSKETKEGNERVTIVAECDTDGNCAPIQDIDR